jgi:queuine tRNA-ribosyltransferase
MAVNSAGADNFASLPDEMFTIIKSASQGLGPRLGRLSIAGREAIDTPHFLGITSRGVVPHLTQDTFARDASISAVYVPLEDCT